MGFSDLNVSMQMRDTIAKLVENTIDRIRPAYRYGVVQTVDGSTSKATVILTGDTNAVQVAYGVITPYVGATVRVNGIGTDRYIEDVLGGGVRQMPAGSNLDTFVTEGRWNIDTAALANTISNLPVPAVPMVAPNNALNPKAIAIGPPASITNSPTYWTVTRGVSVGAPSRPPSGTDTVDVVTPIGSPLGNGYLGSVYNMDGGNADQYRQVQSWAREVSVWVNTTTGGPIEYKTQTGKANASAWLSAGAGWQKLSWSVLAGDTMILEVRKPGGALPVSGNVLWLTDYNANLGAAALGVCRPASQGILTVQTSPSRVMQEFQQVLNLGIAATFRFAQWRRLRSSDGVTWGPWFMEEPPIVTTSEPQQDQAGKLLNANGNSPVIIRRVDQRHPMPFSSRNGDTWYGENGTYVGSPNWQVPTTTGWTNYGAGHVPIGYRRLNQSGIVVLRGLIASGAIPANGMIMNLPPGYRPSGHLMFQAASQAINGTRIDVFPNGDVWATGSSGALSYLSLSGISFPCAEVAPNDAWTQLTLLNGFTDYIANDYTWPPCGYWKDINGRYWFRGLYTRGTALSGDTAVANLPADAAPNLQIHFSGMGYGGFASYHISSGASPQIVIKNGTTGVAFISMPQIPLCPKSSYPESVWQNYALLNSWTNYDVNSFPGASLVEAPDGLIHVRGLIRNGTVGAVIAGVGDSNKSTPLGTLIYPGNSNNSYNRTDSRVADLLSVSGTNAWWSLENIHYVREA